MSYIISIIGVVFLGVMIDVIAPEGKMNNFIKSIFAVFLLFVMVCPIVNLFTNNRLSGFFNTKLNVDEEYLEQTSELRIDNYELLIVSELEKKGIYGVKVEIEGKIVGENKNIKKVMVDTSNLVLTNADEHINKYKVITELIYDILKVKSEVIIYE